jgi:CRISPR/Cas system-associated endonuclease Cas3-HD
MNTYKPLSHPNKQIINHIKGMLSLAELNDLILIAIVFHDLGKMIDNIQKIMCGLPSNGYKNHAYTSTYYFINGFINNKEVIMKRFPFITEENFDVIVLILANVIIGHHGYLRNISEIFNNDDEWNNMINYIQTINMTDHVNTFFKENRDLLNCDLVFFDDINN